MLKPIGRSSLFVKISLVPKGDRIIVRGGYSKSGTELDMRGFIVCAGQPAWYVSIQTLREKKEATVVCSRILESVTIRTDWGRSCNSAILGG